MRKPHLIAQKGSEVHCIDVSVVGDGTAYSDLADVPYQSKVTYYWRGTVCLNTVEYLRKLGVRGGFPRVLSLVAAEGSYGIRCAYTQGRRGEELCRAEYPRQEVTDDRGENKLMEGEPGGR